VPIILGKKIETILIKYFTRSASIEELIELTEWISKHSNDLIFKDFAKTNYLIDTNMLDFDIEGEKEKILQKIIKIDKKSIRKNIFKYAAIFVVAVGLGYVYLGDNFSFQKKQDIITDIQTNIQAGTDKAILTLEDGSEVVLEKDKTVALIGRSINGEKLIYDTKSVAENNDIQYNYLTIPRGGQFYVQLSDGTSVWLNSESKLKYPVHFIKGQTRKVELVYGEAYFDVSKSINHNGDTFRVQTSIQEVEVLGTEFNIKAYLGEKNIVTTLVEGKVSVGNGIEFKYLKPSEQSFFNIINQDISIQKVPKLFDEIAWKEGYFSFKQKSMKEIMKILSRWYDVEYIFKDSDKENKTFTGVLDREIDINKILTYIKRTNEINFKIHNKTVIIE
jgi:ferric-dicitrate binding protein FerR (iron transport regulator)